jgi:hypothetical protein
MEQNILTETTGPNRNKLYIVVVIIVFSCLAGVVIFMAQTGFITIPMAILMLIGLVGIYVGLGILFAVHFMVRKLD